MTRLRCRKALVQIVGVDRFRTRGVACDARAPLHVGHALAHRALEARQIVGRLRGGSQRGRYRRRAIELDRGIGIGQTCDLKPRPLGRCRHGNGIDNGVDARLVRCEGRGDRIEGAGHAIRTEDWS